jgi:hypothetical protein
MYCFSLYEYGEGYQTLSSNWRKWK